MAQFRRPAPGVSGDVSGGRLGGRVRSGSVAFHRKASTQTARADMAEIFARYTAIVREMQGVTPRILREALTPVLERSQIYCPVRTGALRSTGRITVTEATRRRARAVISYGSPGVPYAALVHERMGVFHQPPTRAKFLQSAMEEEFGTFLATLAVYYATVLR